jgi:ATP-dependent Clp protease protease subunit
MSTDVPFVPYRFTNHPYTQWVGIYDRLLKERVIVLGKAVDDEVANQIIAMLLHLDLEDSGKDIRLQINSSGGSLIAALAIADAMQQLTSDVVTVCVGQAQGVSSLLLAVGARGKRLVLPQARIQLHQPTIAVKEGSARDIEIEAREVLRLRQQVNEIYAQRTGQPLERIDKDTERGLFLSAGEALEYGLVDRVLEKPLT